MYQQQPFGQGLIPQLQLQQPTTLGAYNPPPLNEGQAAYMASLQEQIKKQQEKAAADHAAAMKAEADKKAADSGGGGFWGALGKIALKAAPMAFGIPPIL